MHCRSFLTFSNFVFNDNSGILSHVCSVAVSRIHSRPWDEKGFIYKREWITPMIIFAGYVYAIRQQVNDVSFLPSTEVVTSPNNLMQSKTSSCGHTNCNLPDFYAGNGSMSEFYFLCFPRKIFYVGN